MKKEKNSFKKYFLNLRIMNFLEKQWKMLENIEV